MVQVAAGEMFVVPKGVEHKPYAEQEVRLAASIEPRAECPTRAIKLSERTAENDVDITGHPIRHHLGCRCFEHAHPFLDHRAVGPA